MRIPLWYDFCARGLLSTAGEIWSHSRKIWKPAFSKNSLADLKYFAAQVDTLVGKLPGSGSTVNLQPLLYDMVSHS